MLPSQEMRNKELTMGFVVFFLIEDTPFEVAFINFDISYVEKILHRDLIITVLVKLRTILINIQKVLNMRTRV